MWSKIIGFIMSVIMFIGSLFGITGNKKEVRDIVKNTIEYSENKKAFSIAVEENATTGYRWNQKISDESVVELSDDEFIAPEATGMAGVPGTRVFTFSAVSAGKTTITLSYERSWEKGAADTLVIEVEVAADMTVTARIAE